MGKILPGVALQVVKNVNDYLVENNKSKLGGDLITSITQQIESLEDPNQKIRDLIQKRIVDFCKQIVSGTLKNAQVPPGLTVCKDDLGAIAGQFIRLVNSNKNVFGNHCLFQVED